MSPSNPEALEMMIKHCYRQMVSAKEHERQMYWWMQMGCFLKKRSPETVRQMEREKGLA